MSARPGPTRPRTSVTQAELDAGTPIVNVATVTGTGATPDSDDASVAVAQSKILHIEKDATVADGTANSTSDTITYTYTVTNQGNAAIAGVVVTDDNRTPGNPGDDFNPSLHRRRHRQRRFAGCGRDLDLHGERTR